MSGKLMDYLKAEYESAGVSPAYLKLWGKIYLIPYPYVRDYDDFQKAFMSDFFDVMRKDYLLYKKNNEPVQYINWKDEEERLRLVVPYSFRQKNISPDEIARRIFNRADKKYMRAIRLASHLKTAYPERKYQTFINAGKVREMQVAYNGYCVQHNRDKAVYITKRVGSFLNKGFRKATDNIKSYTPEVLKAKAKKWAVRAMLTATVAAAVYNAVNSGEDKSSGSAVVEKKETKIPDAKQHIVPAEADPYGNLQVFAACRDDIKVSLAFVENFARKAFKDGNGVPTIGYGCTYYLDKNGRGDRSTTPVKMGDRITMQEAVEQKDRYLDYRILPQIEKLVKVPMDEPTMIATVNFAYVLGPGNFRKSMYLQALNQGKKGDELAKYMTGFRQQKGLLARTYFMAEILKGNISAADLLDLKAEGCYNLQPKDVCLYKGGRLVTDRDNFAFYRDESLRQNMEKAAGPRKSIVNGGGYCPTVRDILPASVIGNVQKTNLAFNGRPAKER